MTAARAYVATADPIVIGAMHSPFAPDFLLAVACCRWPPSEERVAAIRNAASNVADWDGLPHIVKRHRLIGLATHGIRSAGIALPPSVVDELAARSGRYKRHRLILIAETVRLQNVLVAGRISVIVLKGVALEQLAYTELAAKQTRDIDLLVSPERAEEAWQLIEREGYKLSVPAKQLNRMQRRALITYGREIELVHPQTGMRVELQWRAADNPLLLKGVDARAATQTVSLSESAVVRTLASEDLFAYLCVHGARHTWARLKWLADLNALLVSTNADIEHLYRHAYKIGAGLCAGQGLLLCQQIFGLKLPPSLVEGLGGDKRCRRLVDIAIAALTAPRTSSDRNRGIREVAREIRYQFLLGQGLRFYATQCWVACIGTADIVRLPLPRPLHFLYPLLRLPLWLWRRIKLASSPPHLRPG